MIGEILSNSAVSAYQATTEVANATKIIKKDYQQGWDILNRSWEELNNYSVIDRDQKDKRTFNSFVDESTDDPNEAWKWRGTRSLARNKAMAMHANLTAQYVIPEIFAQNDAQEDDREAADMMHDIVEWMTVNSSYRPAFLMASMGMLVSPAVYLDADYFNVYQTIKEKTDKGYTKNEIIDEILSGFQTSVLSVDQVLITNVYEQNIQKQRRVFKNRYVDYSELEAKYKDHPNWEYLRPGIKCIFNEVDGFFYDVKDEEDKMLCQETTMLCRRDDSEMCFINGIYFGDTNVDDNPIRHRDLNNAPKYNIAPFGYERIGEHFFYYKSLINRVGWDDKLIDAMYEVQMNREFLDLETPMAYTGFDKIDNSAIFPGAWISSPDPNAKATPILPRSGGGGYRAMQEIEDSASQSSSVSETTQGQLPQASQKAYSVAQAAQNAKTILSGVSKNLAQSVMEFGSLMVDIAVHHYTAPEYDEITDKVKYRTFVLHDQTVGGKKVSKQIRFDEAIMRDMTDEEQKMYRMKLLEESKYPENKSHIYVLNPHLFSKMKYLVRIEADNMMPKNQEFQQIMNERMYQLLRQDPLIEPEALVRKLVHSFYRSDYEELIAKKPQTTMGGDPMAQLAQKLQTDKQVNTMLPSVPSLTGM